MTIKKADHGTWHSYTIDGRRAVGVTTALKGIPKDALVPWAAKEVATYVVDNIYDVKRMLDSGGRYPTIDLLKSIPNQKRDTAAVRGTEVHALAEKYIRGEEIEVDGSLRPYVDGYAAFIKDWNPVSIHEEIVVASRAHLYAGTLDSIQDIPSLGRCLVDYKGLALDTSIPTPDGWKTMRQLKVGDQVFGSDGRPCKVTAKSGIHYRPCYRIRFDDGSSVVCDDEHLWRTTSGRAANPKTSVLTTDEIRRTLWLHGQRQHRIPLAGPLDLPEVDLPIHPYVLGCWLGDGKASDGSISKPDAEMFDLIVECGYEVAPDTSKDGKCPTRTVYGLRTQLRQAGLLGHKVIPAEFLRASREQRLALLRGLMDTDGSWNKARRQAVFSNTDKSLSKSVCELACSLGQRAVMHQVTAHGFGLSVSAYPVTFTPNGHLNPFSLSRKADLVQFGVKPYSTRRLVLAVDDMPVVPTQCITVDSPDSTYLCTESMIPTHNTGRGVYGETALQVAAYRYAEVYLDADGNEQPMVSVDRTFVLHIQPDTYDLVPLVADEAAFESYLKAQANYLANVQSKRLDKLLGLPLNPPEAA